MTTPAPGERISLYFQQGTSDKEYHAAIEPQGAGFVVTFAFGRRGSTLQTGTKTPTPVDYATAKKIFDKLVSEKTAKGYSPGPQGTPYQGTPREQRATGIFPQLLNPIDDAEAYRLMADDGWAMQEKFDGKRILVRKTGEEIVGINRSGLIVALPQPVCDAVRGLSGGGAGGGESGGGGLILDGEAVGDAYHAFDLLELGGTDLRPQPYRQRLTALQGLFGTTDVTGPLRLVRTATDVADKRAFLAELRQRRAEGAVFKRLDAPYTPGRPASGGSQVKLKFTATASCLVARANVGKRSVALELLDPAGHRVAVGNVTVPANQPMPVKGDIVEARYLYAFPGPGGALFQPVFLGVRDDLAPAACTTAQLKYKRSDDESEG